MSKMDDEQHVAMNRRYRIKKRNRRKKQLISLFLMICLLGGGYFTYQIISSSEETEKEVTATTNDVSTTALEENDVQTVHVDDPLEEDVVTHNENEQLTHQEAESVITDEKEESFISTAPSSNVSVTDDSLTEETEEKEIIYEIQAGDSLYKLSNDYYHSPQYQQFLADYNNIKDGDHLQIGQTIKIPFPPPLDWHTVEKEEVASLSETPIEGEGIIHEVQTGDTLYSISLKYYHSPAYQDLIIESNGLVNPDALHAGDELFIPAIAEE